MRHRIYCFLLCYVKNLYSGKIYYILYPLLCYPVLNVYVVLPLCIYTDTYIYDELFFLWLLLLYISWRIESNCPAKGLHTYEWSVFLETTAHWFIDYIHNIVWCVALYREAVGFLSISTAIEETKINYFLNYWRFKSCEWWVLRVDT